jgi:ATP-dependent Clp protease ATP-binding subunit ClpB
MPVHDAASTEGTPAISMTIVPGARPLRRFIAREVETRIGRALIAGDVEDGATIRLDVVDGELVVAYENPPEA